MVSPREQKLAWMVWLLLAVCLLGSTSRAGSDTDWSTLPGWATDRQAEVWPALLQSCRKLSQQERWHTICSAANQLPNPSDEQARTFFERHFTPRLLQNDEGRDQGLITGYYVPLLAGSLQPDARYRFPLYSPPPALLKLEKTNTDPGLQGMTRGRLQEGQLVPFHSRAEIDGEGRPLAGHELLWLDDRDDRYFLHVQGSGRVQLPDGRNLGVAFADHNGHPYVSIGKLLIERGELKRGKVTLFTIRQWLDRHSDQSEELLNRNPRYIFFSLKEDPEKGAVGALGVPLTAERSIAIDPKNVPLGAPVWLATNRPGQPTLPYRRLVMAQDTGGAIKGRLRADLFWGHGEAAEQAAGIMQEPGQLYLLEPKPE